MALWRAHSDNARDVINFNKEQMITSNQGGGGDEAGRKGWDQEGNSCRVIESMKNEVLKAQRFEQS